ncbi:hypothetical protein GYB59_23650, partial [bacterium]|nr:hypothetical protein [bacterium]
MSDQDSNAPKTIITVEMNANDVEKLMQAFKDGKLADLGVIDIDVPTEAQGTHSDRVKASSPLIFSASGNIFRIIVSR